MYYGVITITIIYCYDCADLSNDEPRRPRARARGIEAVRSLHQEAIVAPARRNTWDENRRRSNRLDRLSLAFSWRLLHPPASRERARSRGDRRGITSRAVLIGDTSVAINNAYHSFRVAVLNSSHCGLYVGDACPTARWQRSPIYRQFSSFFPPPTSTAARNIRVAGDANNMRTSFWRHAADVKYRP